MNKQTFFLSVLSIVTFGQISCSANEPVFLTGKDAEDALRGFEHLIPLAPVRDEYPGQCVRSQRTGGRYSNVENTVPYLSAEELKPRLVRGINERHVPVYNATDCALQLSIIRPEGSSAKYELRVAASPLITIPDDLQRLEVQDSPAAKRFLCVSARIHQSTYSAKDILPLSEALIFVVKNNKVVLSVGEKVLVPDTAQDSEYSLTLE